LTNRNYIIYTKYFFKNPISIIILMHIAIRFATWGKPKNQICFKPLVPFCVPGLRSNLFAPHNNQRFIFKQTHIKVYFAPPPLSKKKISNCSKSTTCDHKRWSAKTGNRLASASHSFGCHVSVAKPSDTFQMQVWLHRPKDVEVPWLSLRLVASLLHPKYISRNILSEAVALKGNSYPDLSRSTGISCSRSLHSDTEEKASC